jgi:hypothetical protein
LDRPREGGTTPDRAGRSRAGMTPIQDALQVYLRSKGLLGGSQERVFSAWGQVVGEALRRRAVPVRYARGELVVEVDSAAHLHELKNFTGESYRDRLNALLGPQAVRRIVFHRKS